MKIIPSHVAPYKKTPLFTHDTVPVGLLKNHKTKDGVWGKIIVLEGRLDYTIVEPELETVELSSDTPGVIEPTILHNVNPKGTVRFYVEFYR